MTQQSGAGSPQQFCLRWNNYQTNLTNVFDQLLQSESFVDVTLACDGHSVKAHKMVLSACSPYFQALFFDNPCQHPIVIMKDIKWPELKAAVEFMYKGEINVSQEQIGPNIVVPEIHSMVPSTASSTPRSLGSPSTPSMPSISVTPQINLQELPRSPYFLPNDDDDDDDDDKRFKRNSDGEKGAVG
ncbi:Uncharacterized protein DBV15_00945 [Temnothorax longispinosus]|uniref:BTB domain-containing protein n=1 Tax=Temnothorax longispinosus TaxID=300112 RepID=A0A4S2JBI5_9HYME|nr:Uncharacterized protein DBV15_00945 [Temnothorax longispinosus]